MSEAVVTLHANHVDTKEPVLIALTREDVDRYNEAKHKDRHVGAHTPPRTFVAVTDQESGKRWEVACAPCGAECRCAAAAREVPPHAQGGTISAWDVM